MNTCSLIGLMSHCRTHPYEEWPNRFPIDFENDTLWCANNQDTCSRAFNVCTDVFTIRECGVVMHSVTSVCVCLSWSSC